jgi:hypothetical protein
MTLFKRSKSGQTDSTQFNSLLLCSLGECKANKHNQKIKEWRKGYYLQQVRKESCKSYLQSNSLPKPRCVGILFREPTHIHIEKYFGDGHTHEQAQFKMYITEHAQCKIIVPQGKMGDTFLGMFS